MKKIPAKFLEQFAASRAERGLTFRELGAISGIKHSALAAMSTGHRPVGEQSATRIASAFGLSGKAAKTFTLAALNTSKERVLDELKGYPAEVLNALGLLLQAHGIKPRQIVACDLDVPAPFGEAGLLLTLSDGCQLRLETRFIPVP